jgi:ABC-2 type transport system ATP-binding protein
LLGNPRLLILDEPTNGLDPRQIIELRDLIRSLAGACSILVTSHVLSEIERVANRAAILLDGRLLAVQQLKRDGEPVRLRVRVHARDLQAAGTCLEGVAGVLSAQFVENVESVGTWHVDAADASTAERVAAALARAEFGIREIAAAPSDLETQFLRLTSQGAQQ